MFLASYECVKQKMHISLPFLKPKRPWLCGGCWGGGLGWMMVLSGVTSGAGPIGMWCDWNRIWGSGSLKNQRVKHFLNNKTT